MLHWVEDVESKFPYDSTDIYLYIYIINSEQVIPISKKVGKPAFGPGFPATSYTGVFSIGFKLASQALTSVATDT